MQIKREIFSHALIYYLVLFFKEAEFILSKTIIFLLILKLKGIE